MWLWLFCRRLRLRLGLWLLCRGLRLRLLNGWLRLGLGLGLGLLSGRLWLRLRLWLWLPWLRLVLLWWDAVALLIGLTRLHDLLQTRTPAPSARVECQHSVAALD